MSFFLRFYLFIFREGKGGRKRGRETSLCGCLLHTPYWGLGPQPRHVPWLGIESATLCFPGQHSIHRATPARATVCHLYKHSLFLYLWGWWFLSLCLANSYFFFPDLIFKNTYSGEHFLITPTPTLPPNSLPQMRLGALIIFSCYILDFYFIALLQQ